MTQQQNTEPDSTFFLKILLYMILGSIWLRFSEASGPLSTIPVGFLLGLVFIRHDHFAIDRKIEYAILLISTVFSFFLPTGILI